MSRSETHGIRKRLWVVGALPKFVRAASLSHAIRARTEMTEVIVHTSQQFDPNVSDASFRELEFLPPRYELDISQGSDGVNSMLAWAFVFTQPLAPAAHVEAGLRSFNCRMPEEIKRVLTNHFTAPPCANPPSDLYRAGRAAERIVELLGQSV